MSAFSEVDGTVLERLALCAVEISGIKKGFPLATTGAKYSTPYFYGRLGPARWIDSTTGPQIRMWQRDYSWRLVVKHVQDGISQLEGEEAALDAIPYVTLVSDYLFQHPKLHTATLAGLPYLKWFKFADNGPAVRDLMTVSKGVRIDFAITVQFGKRLDLLAEPIV